MLDDLAKKALDDHDLLMKSIQDDFENKMLSHFRENLGINDEEYRAVIFISMLIYSSEKALEKSSNFVIKKGVVSPLTAEMIDYMFSELTFTSKIKVYEKILKKYPVQYKDLIKGVSFYNKLNEIRNKIFHCKLKEILYAGKSITKPETKLLLIKDMIKSCGKDPDENISNRAMAARTYVKKM
jgi:hypothetical protein